MIPLQVDSDQNYDSSTPKSLRDVNLKRGNEVEKDSAHRLLKLLWPAILRRFSLRSRRTRNNKMHPRPLTPLGRSPRLSSLIAGILHLVSADDDIEPSSVFPPPFTCLSVHSGSSSTSQCQSYPSSWPWRASPLSRRPGLNILDHTL